MHFFIIKTVMKTKYLDEIDLVLNGMRITTVLQWMARLFLKINTVIGKIKRESHLISTWSPSLILCKPPMWCKIETTHWRNFLCQEETEPWKKMNAEQKSASC